MRLDKYIHPERKQMQPRRCAVCGRPITEAAGTGRPPAYCGDDCRIAALHRRQDIRYWAAKGLEYADWGQPSNAEEAARLRDAAEARPPSAYLGVSQTRRWELRFGR